MIKYKLLNNVSTICMISQLFICCEKIKSVDKEYVEYGQLMSFRLFDRMGLRGLRLVSIKLV